MSPLPSLTLLLPLCPAFQRVTEQQHIRDNVTQRQAATVVNLEHRVLSVAR